MASEADVEVFIALLAQLRSADNTARSDAEKRYADACSADPRGVFACLTGCILNQEEVVRLQAATLLRRAVLGHAGSEAAMAVRPRLLKALADEPSSKVRGVLVAVVAVLAQEPWPELVLAAYALTTQNAEAGICLLTELMSDHAEEILSRAELVEILTNGLSAKELAAQTICLVSEMIQALGSEKLQALQQALPKLEEAVKSLVLGGMDRLPQALQALISCLEIQPTFFRPRSAAWIDLMLELACAETAETSCQLLAFEWVTTLATAKAGVVEDVPQLPERAMSVAFTFLKDLESEDLHKEGEAKVDFLLRKLGFKLAGPALGSLLPRHAASQCWKERVAAAVGVRAAGEHADDDAADKMTQLLLQLLDDPHAQVRQAAFFALGQLCHDRDFSYNERWCDQIMPVLVRGCGDPVDAVAAKAISALEAHLHELPESEASRFSDKLGPVLISKLQSSCPEVVVASLEAIGAWAIAVEDFDSYYDALTPLLLKALTAPAFREKIFECISLAGLSVSKQKFQPAAAAALHAMLPLGVRELSDCSRDAVGRICKALGPDFAPFLPGLMPSLLEGLTLEGAVIADDQATNDDDLVLHWGDSTLKVRTGLLTEAVALIKLLEVFVQYTEDGFLDFLRPTSQALAKMLHGSHGSHRQITSEVREAIYSCWVQIARVAKASRRSRLELGELVQSFVDKVGSDMAEAEEADDIASMAKAIADLVCQAGDALRPEQVVGVCELAVAEISKSFQRDEALQDQHEEDEGDAEDAVNEDECRAELLSIVTACMKSDADTFVSHAWPALHALLQQWFTQGPPGIRLGLRLVCEVCRLGEKAVPLWPSFMDQVLDALGAGDLDAVRSAAAAVNLAARSPAFAALARRAFGSFQSFTRSRRKDKASKAGDSVVAAFTQLCLQHPNSCPDIERSWAACFAELPLKVDLDECRRLNACIFAQVQSGAVQGRTAARAVGYLCDVCGNKALFDEELKVALADALRQMPEQTLQELLALLSDRQKRKLTALKSRA
ncbi:unnamed protein product [Effrenium voratum]|nr:unnamed protein product [Effrenium voratum]